MKPKSIFKIILTITVALTLLSIILMFYPYFSYYVPARSQTVLGETYYIDWYTDYAGIFALVYPLIIVLLPAIIALVGMVKRLLNDITKRCRFRMLKIACIANIFCLFKLFDEISFQIRDYKEFGAYIDITSSGKLSAILSIILLVAAICLSRLSKKIN